MTNKLNQQSNTQFAKNALKAIALLIATFLAINTNVLAAPDPLPDDLRQLPISASKQGAPNVVLMMDDSGSMNAGWLPAEPTIDWSDLPTYMDTKDYRHIDGSIIKLSSIWFQGPNYSYNPLSYNPGVTYKPWNDNNKAGIANFLPARVGTIDPITNKPINGTFRDPRFRFDAGVKTAANAGQPEAVATLFLFRRFEFANGACIEKKFLDVLTCTAPGPNNIIPDAAEETGFRIEASCLASSLVSTEVCTKWDVESVPMPARYFKFEGTPTEYGDASKYLFVEIDVDVPSRMYPTPKDPKTQVQIQRLDCANRYSCTYAEEAQNFANWYTYYRIRLLAAIAVTSQVLAEIDDKIRLGYGRLNYFANGPIAWPGISSTQPPAILPAIDGQANPGHLIRGVRPFTIGSTDRQEVFDWLFGLNPVGGTPNREAIDATGKYFMRADARGPWANTPGTGDPAGTEQLACRRNFAILATDGGWTDSLNQPRIKNIYPGTPDGTPAQSDSVDGPLILGGGTQTGKDYQYQPTAEPVFGGGAVSTLKETLTDVTLYYWSHDLRPDLENSIRPIPWLTGGGSVYPKDFQNPATWQNMTTHIVGYGLNSVIKLDDAKAGMRNGTAVPWPSLDVADPYDNRKIDDTMRAALASRGDFFSAQSPVELADSLRRVFNSIGSSKGSSTSIAVSTSVITDANDSIFEAGYNTTGWAGTLRSISALGQLEGNPVVQWESSITAFNTRALFTTTAVNTPIEMRWINLTPAQQVAFGSEKTFEYLIGDRSQESPAGPYRTRAAILGSVVNASPLHSKATNFGYQFISGAPGAAYPLWLENKRNTRTPAVFVGSNDGIFHAFNAKTGAELFGFTPRAAIPSMAVLADPAYTHRYLVDGIITEGDAYIGGGWKTLVMGTGGAGPKSLFVLDVSNPSTFSAANVLFEITAKNEPDLGHVLGGGVIAPTKSGKWVVIVGNGYESKNHEASILIFDVRDGTLISKIKTGVGTAAKGSRNGMGPVTPIYDNQRNVIGLYAGDKLGNLWKVDMTSANPSDWNFAEDVGGKQTLAAKRPLFVAKDKLGVAQPISTAPRVLAHPEGGLYIAFGTGKVYDISDSTDTQTQTLYAIRDKPKAGPYAKSALHQATFRLLPNGYKKIDGLTGPGGVDWSIDKGWYVDFSFGDSGGERVIASPRLLGGMLSLSTFNPGNTSFCESGGSSFQYQFDLATGFTRPGFNGQDALTVGFKLPDGVIGGLASLYSPANRGIVAKNSISSVELQNAKVNARYSISGNVITDTNSPSNCQLSGTSLTSQSVLVPTACAGTTPLRVWRDLR